MDVLTQGMTILAFLILACACASKLSSWINMPCLLVFLGVGMLAGSEGIGHLEFSNANQANMVGTIAMAFILFSGGFDTRFKSIRSVLTLGGLLSSIGVLLTAGIVGVGTYYFLNWRSPGTFSITWCFLLGSIISSTDAAAVFSILRSRSVSLRGSIQPLLELESGSNDPMAAFLTIFMLAMVVKEAKTGVVAQPAAYLAIIPAFLHKMTVGLALGLLLGKMTVWLYNKIDLEYDGLYYVLGVGTVLLSFGMTEVVQGNGFMAVYTTGIVMGNSKFIYHNGLGRFSDGMAWLMQVVLFGMLGLLVSPSELWNAKWTGLAVAAFLMLAARPAAVLICMFRSNFNLNERLLVSWVGLRGGAPIMLATYPLMEKIANGSTLFHIVFFIVLTSVLIQGMTIMPAARRLRLNSPLTVHPRVPLEFENTGTLNGETKEYEILAGSKMIGLRLCELGLPRGALVLLIRRGGEFAVPHGDSRILENDGLMILGTDDVLKKTEERLGVTGD